MKASLQRLAERAAAEGLLDVAYTTTDSPFGPLLLATHAAAAWSGSACPTRTPTSCWSTSPTRVSPRVLEAPAQLDEARRELDLYFEGKLDRLRPAARLAAQRRLPPQGAAGDRPHPLRRDPQLHARWRRSAGNERAVRAAGTACGTQPDPARRPLPPRPAQRRRPRRLRRRPADEGGAAASSRACWTSCSHRLKGLRRAGRSMGHATQSHRPPTSDAAARQQVRLVGRLLRTLALVAVLGVAKSAQAADAPPARRARPRAVAGTSTTKRTKTKPKRSEDEEAREAEECVEDEDEEECEEDEDGDAARRPPECLLSSAEATRLRRRQHATGSASRSATRPPPRPPSRVDYGLHGSKGSLYLGGEQQRFGRQGVLRADREPERRPDGEGRSPPRTSRSACASLDAPRLLPAASSTAS